MDFLDFLTSWGVPAGIVTGLALIIAVLNIVYFFIDKGGKVAPAFLNIVGWFKKRKQMKTDMLTFLQEMRQHYTPEALEQRNNWMQWVNDRAMHYDEAVGELKQLEQVFQTNNRLTEDMYIQNCRTIIIDFAHKVRNPEYIASEEEYRRVFNVHEEYERFNEAHNRTNGETDRAMKVINRRYQWCMDNQGFLEDIRQDLFADDDDL
jgi:hypothetical protein